MNPILAYALFTKGIDTYDIAKGHGVREAEVVEALIKYREMKNARPSVRLQVGPTRPQRPALQGNGKGEDELMPGRV